MATGIRRKDVVVDMRIPGWSGDPNLSCMDSYNTDQRKLFQQQLVKMKSHSNIITLEQHSTIT